MTARPSRYGCARCCDPDAEAAWAALLRGRVLARPVDESHFSVTVLACAACGQPFLKVFTELIDWQGGDDSQCWSLLPLAPEERDVLLAAGEADLVAWIEAHGRDRPCLVKIHPRGGDTEVFWTDRGLLLLPHD